MSLIDRVNMAKAELAKLEKLPLREFQSDKNGFIDKDTQARKKERVEIKEAEVAYLQELLRGQKAIDEKKREKSGSCDCACARKVKVKQTEDERLDELVETVLILGWKQFGGYEQDRDRAVADAKKAIKAYLKSVG